MRHNCAASLAQRWAGPLAIRPLCAGKFTRWPNNSCCLKCCQDQVRDFGEGKAVVWLLLATLETSRLHRVLPRCGAWLCAAILEIHDCPVRRHDRVGDRGVGNGRHAHMASSDWIHAREPKLRGRFVGFCRDTVPGCAPQFWKCTIAQSVAMIACATEA
jgi:hypothetical protein